MACTGTSQGATAGAAPCSPGLESPGLERTRFFPRQLVTPDDLTQDQIYFREKSRRHNRMLHGWGVVCGAAVRRGRERCTVEVQSGYILGPYGDEIVIPANVTLDLCAMGLGERSGCMDDNRDPWCGDSGQRPVPGRMYLAVRYAECEARPVRAPSGCGCGCSGDGDHCEYSRIRDGYAFKVLAELPSSYATPFEMPDITTLLPCSRAETVRQCPPCPEDPWVILADITIDADGAIGVIDCFAHRRYVLSFADFFLVCGSGSGRAVGDVAVERPTFSSGLSRARVEAVVSGRYDLVDMQMAGYREAPRGTVTMRRPDGQAVSVPAYFTVRPEDTLGDLLEREGDRQYYDPITDDAYTLRELFAATGVPVTTPINGTLSALAVLEGRTLDVGQLRTEREDVAAVLNTEGLARLDREFAGAPKRVGELSAAELALVGSESPTLKSLRTLSIKEVADTDRETFVARLVESVPQRQRKAAEKEAAAVWEAARGVLKR